MDRASRTSIRSYVVALVPLVLLFAVFNSGSEVYRADTPDLANQFERDPASLLWPPWRAVRLYVSRDSTERLFYNYLALARGRPADLELIAHRRTTDIEHLRVVDRPGPRLPHRDFSIEYPPGAWAAFLPPLLVAPSLPAYRLAFGIWMCILALAGVVCAMRVRGALEGQPGTWHAGRAAAWIAFALGPMFIVSFDALPALCVMAGVWFGMRGRPTWSGIALGLGGAVKIYPLLCVPAIAAALLGARNRAAALRLVLGASSALAAVFVPFYCAAGEGLISDLSLHANRPLHVEAVIATPLLFQDAAHVVKTFGSANLDAPGAQLAALATGPLLVAGVGLACVLAFYAARRDLSYAIAIGTAASVLGVLVASKVLSTQYLLWAFPVVLVLPGRSGSHVRWCFGIAAALTQIYFPFCYNALLELTLPWTLVLAARNALLVAAFILVVRDAARGLASRAYELRE